MWKYQEVDQTGRLAVDRDTQRAVGVRQNNPSAVYKKKIYIKNVWFYIFLYPKINILQELGLLHVEG